MQRQPQGPSILVRLCKHAGFLGFFRLVAPFLELVWRFRAVSMLGFSNFYLACQRDNATTRQGLERLLTTVVQVCVETQDLCSVSAASTQGASPR